MELRVEFCGDEFLADRGQPLSFGRRADIVIDPANRYLHRVVGSFRQVGDLWWLSNDGTNLGLTIADAESASHVRVVPGTAYPIGFESSAVRFEAGGAAYEIDVDLIDLPQGWGLLPRTGRELDDEVAATSRPADVSLSDEQYQLLVALARPLFDGDDVRPTNRQLASELGWTLTKYNRKLDGLCHKFASAGVRGLHGSTDLLAKDRRWKLATHAIETGLVADCRVKTGQKNHQGS